MVQWKDIRRIKMKFVLLNLNQEGSFRKYKKEAIKAAEELLYEDTVIEQLNNSKSEPEIIRIMLTARHNNNWDRFA